MGIVDGLLSGQSILSIPPIPKNEDSGIESRDSTDSIEESRGEDQEEFEIILRFQVTHISGR